MQNSPRALLSVSDKTGIEAFARGLRELGFEILSTGGTAALLRQHGIDVQDVSEMTGFPEILGGRVKTIHPKVHGGILARRDLEDDQKALMEHNIAPIDLVCVNLYPFAATVAREGVTLDEALENIDIGGPCMIRAAAKNHRYVTVVVDPADYKAVLEALRNHSLDESRRRALAVKAFAHTAAYDGAITNYLSALNPDGSRRPFPDILTRQFIKTRHTLRYGENPHQKGAFYADPEDEGLCLPDSVLLQGKPLSFNNIADADAAYACVRDLHAPAVVIVKHANPCGVAMGEDQASCYLRAREADPVSAFGGIVAFNRVLEEETAKCIVETFMEVVIAPGFSEGARRVLANKKHLRLLAAPTSQPDAGGMDFKKVSGGLLVQERDTHRISKAQCKVVSQRQPTEGEWNDMLFAWTVVKHVKSNAIVFAKNGVTLGIGAGQMNRVNAVRIAVQEAGQAAIGASVASDAFFPFRDGIDALAQAGATAVIHPGGSIRDEEVIRAADEHGLAMVFTGVRHFRH